MKIIVKITLTANMYVKYIYITEFAIFSLNAATQGKDRFIILQKPHD